MLGRGEVVNVLLLLENRKCDSTGSTDIALLVGQAALDALVPHRFL